MTEEEQKKIFANNLNHYINASGKQQKKWHVSLDLLRQLLTLGAWEK